MATFYDLVWIVGVIFIQMTIVEQAIILVIAPKASAEGACIFSKLLWSVYDGLLWSVLMVTMERVKWVTMERL